jgi:hypothetical protein
VRPGSHFLFRIALFHDRTFAAQVDPRAAGQRDPPPLSRPQQRPRNRPSDQLSPRHRRPRRRR